MNQNSQQYSLTLALEGQEKIHTFEQGWLQLKLQKEGTKREQELPLKSTAPDTNLGYSTNELQNKLEELTLVHEQELENFTEKLSSAQRSLSESFVERDRVQQQRDELQDQLNDGGQAASESKPCADLDSLKEQAEMLQSDLSKLNSKYKREQLTHAAEKQKWHDDRPSLTRTNPSEEMQQLKEENSYLFKHQKELETELEKMEKFSPPTETADNGSQEELQQLKEELEQLKKEHYRVLDEKEELEADLEIQEAILKRQEKRIESSDAVLQEQKTEWEEEKKNIMRQIEVQNREMKDRRLAVPQNKLILEQEQDNNGELEKRLEETMYKLHDQEEALEYSMKTKGVLIKQRERYRKKHQQLQKEREDLMLQKKSIEGELVQENEMAVPPPTVSPSVGESRDPFVVLMPADIPSSTKNHVLECDWSGDNNLSGKYTGWMDAEGKPDGHGTLRIEDGSIYAGEWLKGQRHGYGVYTFIDGDLYRGIWQEGMPHGRGVFVWEDGHVYTGDYVKGCRQGKGIFTWPHGAKYEGEYQQDKRNGKGTYHYSDGRSYTGEYLDGRPHGKGIRGRPRGQGTGRSSNGPVLYDGQSVGLG